MSIELRKFRNKYDLELIPASHENIILGTLVWDPVLGKPQLDHKGMPDHIYSTFAGVKQISLDELNAVTSSLKEYDLIKAQFAERTISMDLQVATSLDYPEIGKLEAAFGLESIKKFSFGDLEARTMSSLTRVQIDLELDKFKVNNWDKYDGNIRRVFMVTELYYGSVKVVIDSNVDATIEAALATTDIGVKAKVQLGQSVEYTFSHKDVPFAMRIEKVREFNG